PLPWNGRAPRVYSGCRVAATSMPCSSCWLLLVGRRHRATLSVCASCSWSAIGCWTARRGGSGGKILETPSLRRAARVRMPYGRTGSSSRCHWC
ncbi:hypothetical protein AURDEDRAFT_117961, partial [Auricularia subglabra TFB-10046 SS5]